MATLTVEYDKTISADVNLLGMQGEEGLTVTVNLDDDLKTYINGKLAYVSFLTADGQVIEKGYYNGSSGSFTFDIELTDGILITDGKIYVQLVVRDLEEPHTTEVWKSKAHEMTVGKSLYYIPVDVVDPTPIPEHDATILYGMIGTQLYSEENYVTSEESSTASIDALDVALKDVSDNVGDLTYTEENYVTSDDDLTSSVDDLDVALKDTNDAIGSQTYTEDNYVTDSDPLTTSIDDLDMALKDHADLSVLTGTVHGVAITTGSGNLTPTASGGTLTTASATYSYYRIGKILVYQIACTITTKGTGDGLLILAGLPIQYPVRTSGDGYNENGGSMIRGYSSGNAVVVTKYDSTTVIADSTTVHVTMVGLTA